MKTKIDISERLERALEDMAQSLAQNKSYGYLVKSKIDSEIKFIHAPNESVH